MQCNALTIDISMLNLDTLNQLISTLTPHFKCGKNILLAKNRPHVQQSVKNVIMFAVLITLRRFSKRELFWARDLHTCNNGLIFARIEIELSCEIIELQNSAEYIMRDKCYLSEITGLNEGWNLMWRELITVCLLKLVRKTLMNFSRVIENLFWSSAGQNN